MEVNHLSLLVSTVKYFNMFVESTLEVLFLTLKELTGTFKPGNKIGQTSQNGNTFGGIVKTTRLIGHNGVSEHV